MHDTTSNDVIPTTTKTQESERHSKTSRLAAYSLRTGSSANERQRN